MTKTYKIAEHIFELETLFEDTHILCADYLCNGTAEFNIKTAIEDIEFEREKGRQNEETKDIAFPDGYLETSAVYRKLCLKLLEYDIILFHGSAVVVDGEAYLFTAKSGTGKSTHTRLWLEKFSERAFIINDDKPLIKITNDSAVIYGTPWDGKHRISRNTSAPLKAVCILKRGKENNITQMDKQAAMPTILQQTNRPKNAALLLDTIALADKLADRVKIYELYCNISPQAADVAYDAMR